jgi:M6 family metalloprotease-like protein
MGSSVDSGSLGFRARMTDTMKLKLHVAAALAAASVGLFTAPAPATAQCASGTDVRNLDDSAVPVSLKNQILKTPGPIISTASSRYPSGKVVVIRTALQDAPINSAATAAYIDQIFFGTVQGEKSMQGYFQRNSYGSFIVSKGSVPSWFTLAKKITDYAPGIEGNATFLKDVLKAANVNWNALDTNNDDVLSVSEAQIVILIPNAMPGSGFASTRTVNAGLVTTPNGTFTFNSRDIVNFNLKAAADPQFNVNPIRSLPTVAHELSHAFFHLPDRYNPAQGTGTGTGEYDMMGSQASNKWVHLPMHDKIKIGWIQPKIVRQHTGGCLQFVASELQNAALVVVPIDQFLSSPLEYWVVENRQKAYDSGGYDDDLPDNGLAIWYVSVGTYQVGIPGSNDVRLVDFSKPDQDPDLYNNPGSNALFTVNPADPTRILLNRNGQWNLLFFENVSDANGGIYPGLFMYAEF